MDHKIVLGIRSTIRFLIGFIIMYLHFVSKTDEVVVWGGVEFSISLISTVALWFIALLLLVNNWLDITNEEIHYKYDTLRKEYSRIKGDDKP
ncbi:hypothetical protein LCGC14_1611430 [marine sediment metagenome]|uniref:Uncharacterized protein n=1 Tax=marine sediment metagenome TaxID=412755 RepID=A0A0F9I860_9ZZZZ